MTAVDKIKNAARREADAYRAGEERPLGSYLATMGVYAASVAALAGVGTLAGRRLPDRIAPYDVALLGVATHKLSRLIAKDTVTAPLRAPFTRFKGAAGNAELHEEVRGRGIRRAIGDLLTCPFCLDMWIATFFVLALVAFPRATRLAASVLTALTGADALQFAYVALRDRTK